MTVESNYSTAIATPVDRVKSFNQGEAKPKPIARSMRDFSRALSKV